MNLRVRRVTGESLSAMVTGVGDCLWVVLSAGETAVGWSKSWVKLSRAANGRGSENSD